ncbi:MAG TPA: outer membrane beta-barrel protein [Gemmatimonadaceae bacterium]|nr:outer membrane beta-barrel protein [Gemmatimonadaceae bacterium]
MNRKMVVAAAVLSAVSFAPKAGAQTGYVWAGAAATVPIGDSKDVVKTGWLADAGYGRPFGATKRFSWQLQGLFGSSSAKVGDASTTLMGGIVNLSYGPAPTAPMGWYGIVGVGMLNAKPDVGDSESKAAYHVVGGFTKTLSPKFSMYVEARYMATTGDNKLTMIPIAAGLSMPVGGGGN